MDIEKLTKDQAVIISGFTGILCGEFSDFHADVEKRLGRGVQTFELADKKFWNETVKPLYASDFIEIGTIDSKAAKAQASSNLHYEILVKSIIEHVDSHLENNFLDNDPFDRGWSAAMRCVRNNITRVSKRKDLANAKN